MEICKTDAQAVIRLLEGCAALIESHCDKPCQQDKARLCRNMAKKIKKKLEQKKNQT